MKTEPTPMQIIFKRLKSGHDDIFDWLLTNEQALLNREAGYARLQIEKDRERVIKHARINPFTKEINRESIRQTPIVLD